MKSHRDLPGQTYLFRGVRHVYCRRCGRRLRDKRSKKHRLGRACARKMTTLSAAQ